MEMRGSGPAQGGPPMEAGPRLAFSRPPSVTLGDLLKIGHRRLGGGFHRRLQPPKNLAVQGFLAEKPRETGKQEENILCLQLSPAKCAGSGAVVRMWVPGNQVPFRLGSVKDVMSLPGVHFLEPPPQKTPPHEPSGLLACSRPSPRKPAPCTVRAAPPSL